MLAARAAQPIAIKKNAGGMVESITNHALFATLI
jgi:hypothetical protein